MRSRQHNINKNNTIATLIPCANLCEKQNATTIMRRKKCLPHSHAKLPGVALEPVRHNERNQNTRHLFYTYLKIQGSLIDVAYVIFILSISHIDHVHLREQNKNMEHTL